MDKCRMKTMKPQKESIFTGNGNPFLKRKDKFMERL